MVRWLKALGAVAALMAAGPAFAQAVEPGPTAPVAAVGYGAIHTTVTPVDATHGLPVNCITGCSGGGGGSSGGTATAAAPTYVEGATAQPLSLDLSGNLRTKASLTGSLPDTAAGDLAAVRAALVAPYGATATTTITRPGDTTAYAVNDTWADSTSAPTTGGFTLSNACRTSGGAGVAISATIVSTIDPATPLQGEIWVFDSAVTAVNDNAAFALADGDVVKLVGVIPFTLVTTVAGSGTNSYYHVDSLNMAYTCSGSANLRFLVKVKNAYTPANAEALTVRLAVVGTN